MSDPLAGIVIAATELKLAAPKEYEKLLDAMRALEARCQADLNAAEPNVIFPAQGKVNLIIQLRQKLEDCLDLRAKYEARK
jgi:hypothetical protein